MARKKDRSKPPQQPKQETSSLDKGTSGEQLDLIDVGPENLKEIIPVARAYKKIMHERCTLTMKEKELKEKVRVFVRSSGLKPLPDGSFKFKCDGVTIEVTPRDEKISVKEDADDGEGED